MASLTRRPMTPRARVLVAVLPAMIIAACASSPSQGPKASGSVSQGPRTVKSNVRFEDYAGSNACARCHPSEVAAWRRSPMHNMTRDAKLAEIKGPFDGTTFHLRDDSAKLESAGAD